MKNQDRLNGLVCPKCGSSYLTIVDTVANEYEEYCVVRCGKCNAILDEDELLEKEEYEQKEDEDQHVDQI